MLLKELFEGISIKSNRNINKIILDKIVPDLEKFMDDNIDNDSLILSHVIDELNSNFRHMNIKFKSGDINSSDQYVATGETNTQNGDIEIKVDSNSIFSGKNSLYSDSINWATLLSSTIGHEILHRKQITKSGYKIKGTSDDKSPISELDYLQNKHEIQSHAKDAIDIIYNLPNIQTKNDILKYLNHSSVMKKEIEPIQKYWKLFGEDKPKVWKRFMKYVMFYANDF
jgi:hypothetical protein